MRNKLLLAVCSVVLVGAGLSAEDKKAPTPTQVNINQVTLSPEMIRYAVTAERRAIFTAAMDDLLVDATVKSNWVFSVCSG